MKLSVIIPFYKGETFLYDCVSSIVFSFKKNCRYSFKLEILIIIDSETEVEQVTRLLPTEGLDSIDFIIENNKINIGVAATRNKGLCLATGDYVYLIDQDDKVSPDFFEKVVPYMLKGSDFILCNGLYHFIREKFSLKIYYFKPVISLKNIALKDIIRSPGQVVVKKNLINKYKFPVPAKHCGCDDKFCWILIFCNNPNLKIDYIKDCLYNATMHASNYSNAFEELYYCSLELWNTILGYNLISEVEILARKNTNYYRYMLKSTKSIKDSYLGFMEVLRYHLYPNKLLSFTIKKIKTVLPI